MIRSFSLALLLGLAAAVGAETAPPATVPPAPMTGHDHPGCPLRAGTAAAEHGLVESGQEAFAALAEAAALLAGSVDTDWSSARLLALREHLVDMHHVAVLAAVEEEPIAGGFAARVTGSGRTLVAIRRLLGEHLRHVATDGLRVAASELSDGVRLEVASLDPAGEKRLRGLGFYGFLVAGDHHRRHHLALAQGTMRH
jgi:hypothetical protein